MKYREAARKLQQLGCEELPRRSGGSHRKWWNPALARGTVLPDWGAKDINEYTLKAAVKQLGIEWPVFVQA